MSTTSALDGKYGEITSSKKQFHPGEPVFLFRAQDPFAPEAILHYAELCARMGSPAEHVEACKRHAGRIVNWQVDHPELVKSVPGGPPVSPGA